ncbi:MAG: flagellar motor switch protein FliG [Firmicutes bacterium]|nr:flagellar motor switch protein FliG [Bacillota bacterium]
MQARAGLSGRQKAAILMISLGPELSSRVFKHLRDEEIEQLTLEIAGVKTVQSEIREKVFEEFHELALAQQYLSEGGIEYAKEVLEKALGQQKALNVLQRLTASLQVRPFDFLRKADPSQLMGFIQNEHPQTISLILAYLHPDQAAAVLSALPPEAQVEVARRVALMDRTSPEVIKEVEKVLERKLSSMMTHEYSMAGGVGTVVDVLNKVDRGTEKTIIEALEIQDPELAEEIKKRMFVFEDVVMLDDRSVQRVLREVDMSKDLPLALKVASNEVKEKIMKNISKRAQENLKESMQYLGPVRLRDVEEAQQKIVNLIRRLEDEGEVMVMRGGRDEIVV